MGSHYSQTVCDLCVVTRHPRPAQTPQLRDEVGVETGKCEICVFMAEAVRGSAECRDQPQRTRVFVGAQLERCRPAQPGTEANSVLGRCSVNIFAFHLHASPGCRRARAACVRLLTNKEVSSSLTSRVVVQSQCPPPGPPGPARPAQPGHTASTDHNTQLGLGLGLGLSSAF